jgi:hypothetical protein
MNSSCVSSAPNQTQVAQSWVEPSSSWLSPPRSTLPFSTPSFGGVISSRSFVGHLVCKASWVLLATGRSSAARSVVVGRLAFSKTPPSRTDPDLVERYPFLAILRLRTGLRQSLNETFDRLHPVSVSDPVKNPFLHTNLVLNAVRREHPDGVPDSVWG